MKFKTRLKPIYNQLHFCLDLTLLIQNSELSPSCDIECAFTNGRKCGSFFRTVTVKSFKKLILFIFAHNSYLFLDLGAL